MGTNYGRGLIKQVEELTLENERLAVENERLRAENKEIRAKVAAIEAMMEEMAGKFTAEIERLKAQINKNSGNSSKPPSQDGYKRVVNCREPSGRKSGGQPGHPGKRLELPKELDSLIEKGLARREVADHTNGTEAYVTRYTIDVDVTLVVTEHRYSKGKAPLGAEVRYGEKIKSMAVLLSTEGIIAEERLSEFFSEITHGAIKLSGATIENFSWELSKKLDGEMEAIETSLLNGCVLHVDETPERCGEKPDYTGGEPVLRKSKGTSFNAYIRTHSNETTTLYTVNPQKDSEGIERDGILPRYVGIISQDHEAKFYHYGTAHATCGAHLLRELRGLFELQKIPWADEMRRFMSGMNDHKNAGIARGETHCSAHTLSQFEHDYDRLIEKGRIALSALSEKELGYVELRRMLNRLTDYKDCYLLFIRNYQAPFTNNQAERDLRPCKTKQKISGCFRSWNGIQRYVLIRSFLSTIKKRNRSLLHSISLAFQQIPVVGVAE